MNSVYRFLSKDVNNKTYLKYFNYYYGLNEIKEIRSNNVLAYYKYATLLDTACKYNPSFANRYLDSLLNTSSLNPSNILLFNEIKRHIHRDEDKSKFEIKHRIKDIFDDHWDNYTEYFSKYMTIPDYVFDNVERMRNCRTSALGFTLYECDSCENYKIRFNTCKSRFCSSCGTKYAKERADEISKKTFKVKHRHLVFTIPEELRESFKEDRSRYNILFDCCNKTIDYLFNGKRELKRVDKSKAYTITPGFVQVLHTFGRDLKFNPHIHVLISEGGIDSRTNKFKKVNHFSYELLRKSWQKLILDALYQEIGRDFYPLRNKLFKTNNNGFYVYAPPQNFKSVKDGIKYVVRYTGRPVMAESRITNYDGEKITYWYNPHEDESKKITVTEHVYKFIGKLIMHIPKKNYKTVRYYGAYAASVNKKYDGLVEKEFSTNELQTSYLLRDWRLSIIYTFNNDPLKCECGDFMRRKYAYFPEPKRGGVIHEIFYDRQEKYVREGWEQRTGYCPPN